MVYGTLIFLLNALNMWTTCET